MRELFRDFDGLQDESSHVIGADPLLGTVFVHHFDQGREFSAFMNQRTQRGTRTSATQDPLSARVESKKGKSLDAAARSVHRV